MWPQIGVYFHCDRQTGSNRACFVIYEINGTAENYELAKYIRTHWVEILSEVALKSLKNTLEGAMKEVRNFEVILFVDIDLRKCRDKKIQVGKIDFPLYFLSSTNKVALKSRTSNNCPLQNTQLNTMFPPIILQGRNHGIFQTRQSLWVGIICFPPPG